MAECYRHSGRQTSVSCSNCERPICPDCMTPTPVGMRCPECSGQKTKVIRPAAGFGLGAATPVTRALIAINVAVAVLGVLFSGDLFNGGGRLINDGALFGPAVEAGEWWRIITSGFLHSGLFHLALNAFALFILGSVLEPALGSVRFAGLYAASLLTGSLGVLILDPNAVTVGASGAVFGVFGATFLIARERGLGNVANQIGLWLILNLVLTFSVRSISVGGHLGGLAGGLVIAAAMIALDRRLGSVRSIPASLGLCAAVGVAAFAASIALA